MTTICLGKKKDGTNCSAHTSYPNGYCYQHQAQVPPSVPAPTPALLNNAPWIVGSIVLIVFCLVVFGVVLLLKDKIPSAPIPVIPIAEVHPTLFTPSPTLMLPAATIDVAPAVPTSTAVSVVPTSAVPYNLLPQPQIGHPSLYLETGIPDPFGQSIDAHTKHWVIELLPGTTAIIGGFKVDGVSNGVYKAQVGPGTLDVTVTNGFVAITKNEWASAEFCFRVSQAVQFNWAHQTVLPLPGWTCQ